MSSVVPIITAGNWCITATIDKVQP
jgi:hypothetical protein